MTLRELDPYFLKSVDDRVSSRIAAIADADGIGFSCPECYRRAGTLDGVHGIVCWSPTVRADRSPGPGRWRMDGTSFDDLSLRAGSSSVLLTGGCAAHFFVTDGQIVFV